MAQVKKKTTKKLKTKPRFSPSALLFFALAFVITGIISVALSMASATAATPHGYSPNSSTNYKIAPTATQPVQFVTYFNGGVDSGVMMQVAYHKKGDSAKNAWTTLATDKLAKIVGPNGVNMAINSNYRDNEFIDQNGLNCGMGYGKLAPPKSCTDTWKNSRMSGTAAFNSTNVYFPQINLSIGNYEWATRTYNLKTKKYSGWSVPIAFVIKDATAPVPPAPVVKHVTIETFGYSFAGPPSGMQFVADVRNINVDKYNFQQTERGSGASSPRSAATVRSLVMSVSTAKTWLKTMEDTWTPKLKDGSKVAIGCARGHHRSVALAVMYGDYLKSKGYVVTFIHRDINKTW